MHTSAHLLALVLNIQQRGLAGSFKHEGVPAEAEAYAALPPLEVLPQRKLIAICCADTPRT